MVDFSQHRSRGQPTSRVEVDLHDCEVAGAIPRDLDGALYRMHLDWLYPPAYLDETPLAADGYISMFRIQGGRARYKGRFVQTERYLRQLEAGRQVYGYYRNPYTDEPNVRDIAHPNRRTTANTTPVVLAGKLYATKEDGLPYEIDPNTLATVRHETFGERYDSETFTAHPKYDPVTGETFAYGYEAKGLCTRDVFVCCFDRDGRITREWRFLAPHTSMLHDMWLSNEHLIIPGGGSVTDVERLKAGQIHWGWDTTRPSWHAVIPRHGGDEDIRFFFGPERSIVHTTNARTEGRKIVLDAPAADGNTWPWFNDIHGAAYVRPPTTLRRLTLDLDKQDGVAEEKLFDTVITSFTRIDERYLTQPYRYAYVQYADTRFDSGDRLGRTDGNCIARIDVHTNTITPFFPGPARALHEPVFIPARATSPEGEGYLLAAGDNLEQGTTELYVIEALSMHELARIILPFRSTPQVHGTWATPGMLPLMSF